MSLIEEGRRIVCDGENCHALGSVPVALRPVLKLNAQAPRPDEGWLYILNKNSLVHLCPGCARRYLARHKDENRD